MTGTIKLYHKDAKEGNHYVLFDDDGHYIWKYNSLPHRKMIIDIWRRRFGDRFDQTTFLQICPGFELTGKYKKK